jgi:hypothetical protein
VSALFVFLTTDATADEDPWIPWHLQVYPAYEIRDTNAIDLHDGSLSDWAAVAPGPSVPGPAFLRYSGAAAGPIDGYDPVDLDFEVWLGWHAKPPRIYVGLRRMSDDVYAMEGEYRRDGLVFAIGGDHSGGRYRFDGSDPPDPRNDAQAQLYLVWVEDDGDVELSGYQLLEWGADAPPYAEAGGDVVDADQGSTVVEFYVTPFDTLHQEGDSASAASVLESGRILGFAMQVCDNDGGHVQADTSHIVGAVGTIWYTDAKYFVDMELRPADASSTMVEEGSWGCVKEVFRRGGGVRGSTPADCGGSGRGP